MNDEPHSPLGLGSELVGLGFSLSTSDDPTNSTHAQSVGALSSILSGSRYRFRASGYAQWWILSCIFLLSLRNLYRRIRRRRRLVRAISPRSAKKKGGYQSLLHLALPDEEGAAAGAGAEVKRSVWKRYATALGAGWRNTLYLSRFPVWLYMPESVLDALWTVVYSLVFGFFCLRKTDSWWPETQNNVANQVGVMSFSQIPIIVLLVSKNNPISSLTGITYQKLNYLHRASARICLFASWLHTILWTPRIWEARDTRPYLLWGIAALVGYTLLWLTSFRIIRRLCYEFFIVAHIIFTLLYLVGAYFHWSRLSFWVWPALALWVLDRFIRGLRTLHINRLSTVGGRQTIGECKIELLGQDVMRAKVPNRRFRWKAGQHAYITAPSFSGSPHEIHPFSIANVPTEMSNEVYFLIRVHSGFTKRLCQQLESDTTTSIPLYLDGPYGTAHSLSSYSTVLLLAGGTGITFIISHLLQLLQQAQQGQSATKLIHLVWHIRHAEDIEWITPLLNEGLSARPEDVEVLVDIYVTKTHASDEPYDPPEEAEIEMSISDRLAEVGPKLHLMHLRQQVLDHDHISPNPAHINDQQPLLSHQSHQTYTHTQMPPINTRISEIWDEDIRNYTYSMTPSTPITPSSTAPGTPGIVESRDEQVWVPKRSVARRRFGLSKEAAEVVRWKKGRADLSRIVEGDRKKTPAEGAMNVSVCGPVQLLDSAKQAVKEVSTFRSSVEGLGNIDFFEETLGA